MAEQDVMVKLATLSDDGKYRYDLTRRWDAGGTVLWIMLNPSTADASIDDPTIRRCIGFSKRMLYGAMIVVNLYALRATDPKELRKVRDPVGPDNDEHIARQLSRCDFAVAAWGASQEHDDHHRRRRPPAPGRVAPDPRRARAGGRHALVLPGSPRPPGRLGRPGADGPRGTADAVTGVDREGTGVGDEERTTFTATGDTRKSLLEHAHSIAQSFYGDSAFKIVNVAAHPAVVVGTGQIVLWEANCEARLA